MKVNPQTMVDRAQDRRELAKVLSAKTSKWPRTERRQMRIRRVLERRQPDLTVVLENVHDPHNVSAVLRSCDAVGVLKVHTIYGIEQPPERAYARTTSASAAKWIEVERHGSVDACYARLHELGFRVLATALTPESESLEEVDLTQPVALVFGNEMRGVSEEAVAMADGTIEIPMRGMIESLNISVACAVTLFEAARQRAAVGAYDRPKLAEGELQRLTDDWLRR
jgi:tRNA (guanosine-2'-O-)-methyltransferase